MEAIVKEQLMQHAKAIMELINGIKPEELTLDMFHEHGSIGKAVGNEQTAEDKHSVAVWMSIKETAELVFQHFGWVGEDAYIMNNFLTAQIKYNGYISFRNSQEGRRYKVTAKTKEAVWMLIPTMYLLSPDTEFTADKIRFVKENLPEMYLALWKDNPQLFRNKFMDYKEYTQKARSGLWNSSI